MPAPTIVGATWVPAVGASVKIGTVEHQGLCVGGGYKVTADRDDMSNHGGAGWKESVQTLSDVTGTVIVGWKVGTAPALVEGAIYAVIIDNAPNGPYLAGNFSIDSGDYPVLDPKVGVKATYTITSQGAVTRTRPGP